MTRGVAGLLALVLTLGAASGCGFRPRGSGVATTSFGRLFVDADRDLSIEEALREALRRRSFVIAADRDEADVVLRVSDERQSQRILSVRSTGRVSEYELAHAVSMLITRSEDAGEGTDASPSDTPGADADFNADASGGADEGIDVDADVDVDRNRDVGVEPAAREAGRAPIVPDTVGRGPTGGVDAPDRVEVRREYTYDESQVLGKENEARILRTEMSEELVRQVVLRTIASLARTASAQ